MVNSNGFKIKEGHENPKTRIVEPKTFEQEEILMGQYMLHEKFKKKVASILLMRLFYVQEQIEVEFEFALKTNLMLYHFFPSNRHSINLHQNHIDSWIKILSQGCNTTILKVNRFGQSTHQIINQ